MRARAGPLSLPFPPEGLRAQALMSGRPEPAWAAVPTGSCHPLSNSGLKRARCPLARMGRGSGQVQFFTPGQQSSLTDLGPGRPLSCSRISTPRDLGGGGPREPPHLSEPSAQQGARSWGAGPRGAAIGTRRGQLQAGMGPAAPKAAGEGLALRALPTAHVPERKPA